MIAPTDVASEQSSIFITVQRKKKTAIDAIVHVVKGIFP